jgi:exportin-T
MLMQCRRFDSLDPDTFATLRQEALNYISSEYVYGPAEAGAQCEIYNVLPYVQYSRKVDLRNKFSHTLTLLFLRTYTEQWPSFFADLFSLIRPAESTTFNPHVSLLLFHLILEISGEVADNLIKAARTFTDERHRRDGVVRDAVRERDAATINQAVITIVSSSADRMRAARVGGASGKELDEVIEIVDWGIRTFGSYVGMSPCLTNGIPSSLIW